MTTHITQVNPGLGTTLQLEIASTYTTVAQQISIDGPEMTVGTADTTNLLSHAKTKRGTIPDGGTISGTAQLDPNDPTHLAMFNLIWTFPPPLSNWKLNYADGSQTTDSFAGILTKWKSTGMEIEENLEVEFEIEISGVVTQTSASA